MSNWKPIEKKELNELINSAEMILEGIEKNFWRLIKLPKFEKWQLSPLGDLGGGFWVVAVFGGRCIFYNDIEEGFNISTFNQWGRIDKYFADQLELDKLVSSIVYSRFAI